jgi:hypothetical protein
VRARNEAIRRWRREGMSCKALADAKRWHSGLGPDSREGPASAIGVLQGAGLVLVGQAPRRIA